MICPKCDIEYKEGNLFCSKCGSKLVINKDYLLEQEELEKAKQKERLEIEQRQKEREMAKQALLEFSSLCEPYSDLLKTYEKYKINKDYPKDERFLFAYYPSHLSQRFFMRDDYKEQLSIIKECRSYMEDFLHYAVFYNTTKDEVINELLTLSNELNTLLKEFNSYPKLLDKFLEKNKGYKNSGVFYGESKKIVDIASALINGGQFSFMTEKSIMKYMSPITEVTHYVFEHKYSISNRLQIKIKNEKDDLKAGIFAINIRGEFLILINALKKLKEKVMSFNVNTSAPGIDQNIYIDGFSSAILVKRYVEIINR